MTNNYLSRMTAIEYRGLREQMTQPRSRHFISGRRLILGLIFGMRVSSSASASRAGVNLTLVCDEVGLGDEWHDSPHRGFDTVAHT